MLSTFIISESKTLVEGTECYRRYQWFVNIFKNFNDYLNEDGNKNGDEHNFIKLENSDIEINDYTTENEIADYVQNIHIRALDLTSCDNSISSLPNQLYCPDIRENLVYIYSQYPVWTNVMKSHFNSNNIAASSAKVEAYFKDMRNSQGVQQPLNANKFILTHKKIIDSQIKIAKAAIKNSKKNINYKFDSPDSKKLPIDCQMEIELSSDIDNANTNSKNHKKCSSDITEEQKRVDMCNQIERVCNSSENKDVDVTKTESSDLKKLPVDCQMEIDLSSDIENTNLKNYKKYSLDIIQEQKRVDVNNLIERICNSSENNMDVDVTKIESPYLKKEHGEAICQMKIDSLNHLQVNESGNQSENDESYIRRWVSESENSCEDSFDLYTPIKLGNLIQNGLILPTVKTSSNEVIKLKNTCPVDSIVEVLVAAYLKPTFRNLVLNICLSNQTSTKCFSRIFNIVHNYVKSYSRHNYYIQRAEYCKIWYAKSIRNFLTYIEIDCRDNVTSLFEKIFMENYSVTKQLKCNNCNLINTTSSKLQHINTNFIVHEKSLTKLQEYLTSLYATKHKSCYECKNETAVVSYRTNSYFCVELETNFLFHKDLEVTLSTIPEKLYILKEIYSLVGVIVFTQEYDLMHYFAFIKLSNGKWEERNDLKNEIFLLSNRSNKRIRPALLLYIRNNVYKSDNVLNRLYQDKRQTCNK